MDEWKLTTMKKYNLESEVVKGRKTRNHLCDFFLFFGADPKSTQLGNHT
jgi:hypothetical protein